MNWQLIQGVSLPSPNDSWDRLQQTPKESESSPIFALFRIIDI